MGKGRIAVQQWKERFLQTRSRVLWKTCFDTPCIDAPNRLLGEYSLPIYNEEGKLVLESLGEIITSHKHFHDETHIFPVGYRVQSFYRSADQNTIETLNVCRQ